MRQRVGGRGGCGSALDVSLSETASSADLGGSSKYSNENFEDRSGEGFHVNSSWTWVGAPAASGCLSCVALVEPSLRAAAQGAVASPPFVLPHRGPARPATP